ncbi:MAG TPA: alpha-ketoglutarate-dependent dioxygenase AlkB [Xanthobacteraceae bacterium]|jgi:alkylated DNA repair dioxygenase AlkB
MPPRRRTPAQTNLFEAPAPALPEGFTYRPRFLSEAVEQNLLKDVRGLPFREFEFHGFLGKRRIVSFGWRYDFNGGGLQRTEDIPEFLRTVREKAAAFAGLPTSNLQQVLITEYRPGAAIGWHKDRSVFGEVVGISLLSSCMFRLRRRTEAGWQRASLRLEPRSAYLLAGSARTQWEHSIPAVDDLRYSLTFRNLKESLRRRS